MKNNNETRFIQIKKILKIINSCESEKQLNGCRQIIKLYINYLKAKGVTNYNTVYNRLIKELNQKSFQIKMIKSFISMEKHEVEANQININLHVA